MQDLVLNSISYHFYSFRINREYIADYLDSPRKTYEIYYFEDGDGEYITEDQTLYIKSGQMLYSPPDSKYKLKINNHQGKICNGRTLCLRFIPDVAPHTFPPQVITPDATLLEFFSQVPTDTKTETVNCFFLFKTYQFLNELLKYLSSSNEKFVAILQPALDYMNENDKYTIPELAKLCNISEAYFYALFKKVTGLSPVKMRQKIQATKAEQLLKTTDLSVDEIAEMVGFSSASHFRSVFRTRFSCSPNAIRKNAKKL